MNNAIAPKKTINTLDKADELQFQSDINTKRAQILVYSLLDCLEGTGNYPKDSAIEIAYMLRGELDNAIKNGEDAALIRMGENVQSL